MIRRISTTTSKFRHSRELSPLVAFRMDRQMDHGHRTRLIHVGGGADGRDLLSPAQQRVTTTITIILCLLGALWQMTTVTVEYLQYEVVTELYLKKTEMVYPPAMSLCLPYADLIDVRKLRQLRLKGSESFEDTVKRMQEELTIEQLLKLSPNIRDYVTEGWTRRVNSYNVDIGVDTFAITKYIKDFYVCYR